MTIERLKAIHELAMALMNARPDLEQHSLDEWLITHNEKLTDHEIIIGNEIVEMYFDA